MIRRTLLGALCLIGLITAVAFASGEAVDLGPLSISLDLSIAGAHSIETEQSSELMHNYDRQGSDFQYTIYPATVSYDGSSSKVMIEAHQMSETQKLDDQISGKEQISGLEHCIEQSEMMPRRPDYQSEAYTIDGHEGILATVNTGDANPLYIAAYSPDESDGSGSIVCIIGSDFPWETTKSIFDSVSAQVK